MANHDIPKTVRKSKKVKILQIENPRKTGLEEIAVDASFSPPRGVRAYCKYNGPIYVMCGARTLKSMVMGISGNTLRSMSPPQRPAWDYRKDSFSPFSYSGVASDGICWVPNPSAVKTIDEHTEGMFFHPALPEQKAYIMYQLEEHKRDYDLTPELFEALASGSARLFPIASYPGPCVVVDSDAVLPPRGHAVMSQSSLMVVAGNTTLPRIIMEPSGGTYVKRVKNERRICHDFRWSAFADTSGYYEDKFKPDMHHISERKDGYCVTIAGAHYGKFTGLEHARNVRDAILGVKNG